MQSVYHVRKAKYVIVNIVYKSYIIIYYFKIFIRKMGFPGVSVVKNPPVNARDMGSIPGSGRFPGVGNDNPLQSSCLGNFMDRRAWRATVHGATKSQIRLSTHTHTTEHTHIQELSSWVAARTS